MGGRKKTNTPYLAGLDGLRAVAVIAVLAYHLFPTAVRGGFIGVDIFFVISGFLITSLLITEHASTGRVSLKKFWLRRARRLLPALFVTIGVTCSVALLIGGDILVGLGRQVLGAATFSNNWIEAASGANYFDASSLHLFTNFWSLAVEEQFYAVWPFILAAVLGITALVRRYRVGFAASLLLAAVSTGLMFVWFDESNPTRVYYGSDTHAFGLMIGAALAFLGNARYARAVAKGERWPSARFKYAKILQTAGWLSFAGIAVLVFILPELAPVTYRGGLLLASLLSAVVILAAVNNRGLLQQLLETKPLKWVGVRSYGIYLWHWPVIVLCYYGLSGQWRWVTPIITVVSSVAAAALSYRYLEQPIRTMGAKAFFMQSLRRRVTVKGKSLHLQPFVPISLALIALTVTAVITAPAKTEAQRQVEANAAMLARTQKAAAIKAQAAARRPKVITGKDITLVGDSVALASAPELQAKFPGIYIDAVVSRSMRRGGLETVEHLLAAKQMRRVLVVALGTNGYFGDGTIPQLLREVGKDRDVVLVTAHAPVVWVPDNNHYVHDIAKRYHNVRVAEWDTAISAHPEILGPDGIHPGPTGGEIYAGSIAAAIAKFK
jgi:peptidoglycan/LPS O-acetylase OafA/YrhL